jgi:nicotinate dehydrogenase subunit A
LGSCWAGDPSDCSTWHFAYDENHHFLNLPSVSRAHKDIKMELMINEAQVTCHFPANAFAIFALRNDLGLKGVRMGCGDGHCGACTILVDGVPTTSCNLPFAALEGKKITTPEGVGTLEHPHPVQAAVWAEQPGQCGFCLSGILMRSVALVDSGKSFTESEVRAALDHHLCRCGSQPRIIKAVMAALEKVKSA